MKTKKIIILLLMIIGGLCAQAQNSITIINGIVGTTNSCTKNDPVERCSNYSHFQMMYTASELNSQGLPAGSMITSVGFSISQNPDTLKNFTISMGNTSQSSALPCITNLTLVKPAFTYYPTLCSNASVFDMIPLQTPFVWDGISNIVVNTCTGSNVPRTTNPGGLRCNSLSSLSSGYIENFDVCNNYSLALNLYRPIIRFGYTAPNCILTAPWSESFDQMGAPGYPIGYNILPTCWKSKGNTNGNYTTWASSTGVSWQPDIGLPLVYQTPWSAPNYITCYYTTTDSNKYLITPGFNLTAGNTYAFSFKFVGDGYNRWDAEVRYNTTQSEVGSAPLGAPFLVLDSTASTSYKQVVRPFAVTTSGIYYFVIRVKTHHYLLPNLLPWWLGFDDFCLTEVCKAPTNITLTNCGSTNATITWTAPSPAPLGGYGWEVRNPTTGTVMFSGTSMTTSTTITGLSSATTYNIYVRSICDPSP